MSKHSLPFYRSIFFQLSLCLGSLAVLPVALVSYLNCSYGARILNDTTAAGLYAIAQYQSKNIQDFMAGIQKNMRLLGETPNCREGLSLLYSLSQSATAREELASLEAYLNHHAHDSFIRFMQELKFKNIFLVSPDIQFLYDIVEKRFIERPPRDQDAGSITGSIPLLASTQLLLDTLDLTYMVMSPQVSDFALASGEGPSVLFSYPIFSDGVFIGLLAAEVASEAIYTILHNYTGLDETGEIVISQLKEERVLVLNPTRNDPHVQFREDTFAQQPQSAMYKALRCERGFGPALDYRGQAVLAAWEYLPRLRWGLVVKKDLSEVLNPSARLKNIALSIGLPTAGILVVLAFFIAQRFAHPLRLFAKNAKKIAEGKLQSYYEFPMPNNELKTLAYALSSLHKHLKSFIDTTQATEKLVAHIQADRVQSVYLQTKATYTHKTILQRMGRFSKYMHHSNKSLLERLRSLLYASHRGIVEGDASQHKIRALLSTVHTLESTQATLKAHFTDMSAQAKIIRSLFLDSLKIADRSNILALNTTLEMHQMESSTLGFRVVAQEIQKLSEDMDSACLHIEKATHSLDQALNRTSNDLKQFSKMVHEAVQAIDCIHAALNQLMDHLSILPTGLKEALGIVEEQAESMQRTEASMQTLHSTIAHNTHTFDSHQQSLTRLRSHSLSLEKELAEFKT